MIFRLQYGKSIFGRLIFTFLVIIIPIYILGIYIYNWGLHTVKDEISSSTITQVSFYLENLGKEIERIRILQYDCLNDEDLNRIAVRWEVMDNYDRTECIRQLQQRLITIKNSSNYILNVSAHIRTIGRTISSNDVSKPFDSKKFQGMHIPSDLRGAQIISYEDELYLSTFHHNQAQGNNPMFLIEIELNQQAFKQALEQFNTYNGSGSLLVTLIDNGIIMNESDAVNIDSLRNTVDNIGNEDGDGVELLKINQKNYYVVYSKSEYLNMALLKYIPEEYIFKPLKNFYVWVWVYSVAALAIIIIFSVSLYKFIHKPLLKLVNAFGKVESGNLQISIKHHFDDEFGYLYKSFNDMVKNLNMLITQVYNQRILMQRAELKHLQAQINPHFLYNSFFMLNTMATVGDENLIPFTKHLGEYFRFVTRSSSDYVPLKDEINHAKAYTSIQMMRFPKRLQVRFADCPEQYMAMNVPRLILQPIIENAFEHGIEKKKSNGIITVDFMAEDKALNIIVDDNGSDMTDECLDRIQKQLKYDGNELETTGIINIHRRMMLVYGEGSGLSVQRSELGGLKVILKIRIQGDKEFVQAVDC